MKKRICIVAEDYPSQDRPNYPFVQELARGLTGEGFECYVIAPQSLSKALIRREKVLKKRTIDLDKNNRKIIVYRPYIITFSNIQSRILSALTSFLYQKAIAGTIKKIRNLQYVYCYFWHIGLITAKSLQQQRMKLFVQASECDISINESYRTRENLSRIAGVVCASKKNYDESKNFGLITSQSNTVIIPNGFRKEEFYPMDKYEARNKMGIAPDVFVVAFVGDFNERKGTARLSKALDRFDDVYSIFIGKGNIEPTCKNILFKGTVPHEQLVQYLNCADIFVLPTQAEGCCNAIIEAVACGLPVVSSNKPFNDEILDDSYSIRIDENNIDEIAQAISDLKENRSFREQMSACAIHASVRLTMEKRINSVISFLESSGTASENK